MKKRIAIYGGTFDPVHNGHIEIARRVRDLFSMDEVFFIPAHVAPHKRGSMVSAGLHRYAMLALATQQEPKFKVLTIELETPDRPYTIETLRILHKELGSSSELFFIMGMDSWMEITTWREWEELLSLTNHIVVTRPGYYVSKEHVPQAVRERIIDVRGLSSLVGYIPEDGKGSYIYLTDAVKMDISATEIRRTIHMNQLSKLSALIPQPIADYIKKYRLYQDIDGTELSTIGKNNAH
jgi:nicotinate-nucleotide adenylyltransferase